MNAAETYRRHATQHANSAPEQWHIDAPFINDFLDGLPEGAELLDIGSGAGNQAAYFVNQGFRTTLSDATPEMLEIAKKTVPEADSKIIRLPEMIDGKYNAIFCRHVLHHLPWHDFLQSLEMITQALESDGRAGLIFPISKTGETIIRPYVLGGQTMERNFYPLVHVRAAIHNAGLTTQKEYVYTEQDDLKDIRCIYQTVLRPA